MSQGAMAYLVTPLAAERLHAAAKAGLVNGPIDWFLINNDARLRTFWWLPGLYSDNMAQGPKEESLIASANIEGDSVDMKQNIHSMVDKVILFPFSHLRSKRFNDEAQRSPKRHHCTCPKGGDVCFPRGHARYCQEVATRLPEHSVRQGHTSGGP